MIFIREAEIGPFRFRSYGLWRVGFVLLGMVVLLFGEKHYAAVSNYQQALLRFSEQRWDECIPLCLSALREDPKADRLYELVVQASQQRKNLPMAFSYFEQLRHEPAMRLSAHYGLGLCSVAEKNYTEAIAQFEQAIVLDPEFYPPYLRIGETYRDAGRSDAAVKYFANLSKRSPRPANAFLGQAYAYELAGKYTEALDALNRCLRWNPRQIMADEIKRRICHKLQKYNAAIEAAEAIEKLDKAGRNMEIHARNYWYLGDVYAGLDLDKLDRDKAESYYKKAISLARDPQVQDRRSEETALRKLGALYGEQGRYEEALKHFEASGKLCQQAGYLKEKAAGLWRKGELYHKQVDLANAYQCFRQAADLSKEINYTVMESNTYRGLGHVFTDYTDYETALYYFNKALAASQDPIVQLLALQGIGNVYLLKVEYDRALEHYQKALRVAPPSNNAYFTYLSIGRIGLIYFKLGKYPEALRYLEEGVAKAKKANDRWRVALWQKMIGDVMRIQGKPAEAEQWCKLALAVDAHRAKSDIYEGLGDVQRDYGFDRPALEFYEQAIQSADENIDQLTKEERDIYWDFKISLYEKTIDLLILMSRIYQEPQYLKQAFDYVQKFTSQSLLESLVQAWWVKEQLPERLDKPSYKRLLAIQNEISRLYKELATVRNRGKGREAEEKAKELEVKIGSLSEERRKLVPHNDPHYTELIRREKLTVEEIQTRVLKPGQSLLVYFVGKKKAFAFILSRNRFLCKELIGVNTDILIQQVGAVSPLLFNWKRSSASPRIEETSANIQLQALHQLYMSLFKPLEEYLDSPTELIIVPDSLLYRIPFEMLVTRFRDQEKPSYLIHRYAISYTYALAFCLPNGVRHLDRPVKENVTNLLIGNPDFRRPRLVAEGGSPPAGNDLPIRRAESYNPLPFAQRELQDALKYVRNSKVYTGNAATERVFKTYVERAELCHLATHAVVDSFNPRYSHIAFTLDPSINQRDQEDGLLYPYEILDLSLRAELILLIGCQTGSGKMRPGEGIDGLARAFLHAGARSVLATLWDVTDNEDTVELVREFYRHLARGVSKSRALQQAKLDLIEQGRGCFSWAPFVLIGDPNGRVTSVRDSNLWIYVAAALVLLLICCPRIARILRSQLAGPKPESQ
ncbi:MAG: CHAT domain-containing protein [Acidobacteria bacterium]|nr:CHAT domain-containing protein [Acidobacteriota bacterium]